jgi:L-amino acid N-acyltransferase YncA
VNISISRLGAEDVPFAVTVLKRFNCQQPTFERLQAFLSSEQHFFVAALVAEECAGFAYAYDLPRPDGYSMLFLYSIDVLPEYRRCGVGRALVFFLRELAEARRMTELFVFTTRSNEAAVALCTATGGVVENGDDLCFVYSIHASSASTPKAPNQSMH